MCGSHDRSSPMTKQISPLRQRMIDDMSFRNMSPNTQKVYTCTVATTAPSTAAPRLRLTALDDV